VPVPERPRVGVNLQFCAADVREVLDSAAAALGVEIVEVEIPDARFAASSLMQSEARKLYWDRRSEFSQQVVDVLATESRVVEFPGWPFPPDLDAILLPTVPITAAPLGTPGLESKYFRFTALASITGYPALSVPAGLAGGLPVGAQLIGRPGSESLLCRLGTMIEEAPAGSDLANARADLVYQISPPR
jgi:hypothetical protein